MAHQDQDPKNLLIVAIGLGSVVTLTGVMFGLYSYYQNLRDDWQHVRIAEKPNADLVALRAENSRVLTSYAYTDASRKTVRIPVGDAMTLLAQRGRDAFPSIQPAAAATASAGGAAPAMSGAAPATSGSAAPAGSGSAAPGGSAVPASSATPGDKKDHH